MKRPVEREHAPIDPRKSSKLRRFYRWLKTRIVDPGSPNSFEWIPGVWIEEN